MTSAPVLSVSSLWSENHRGNIVTLPHSTVISGPSEDGSWFVVQDPLYGHGLAVQRATDIAGWPFPIGAQVRLQGWVGGSAAAPILIIDKPAGIELLGTQATPIVYADPPSPLAWTLTRWHDVTVRGDADPSGRAATSLGRPIELRLGGPAPAWGSHGDLTGIVLPTGGIAPRVPSDWTGALGPGPIVSLSIVDLLSGTVPPGATVRFLGVQVSPWSLDDRWAVVQAPNGLGLWIDTEGWGVGGASTEGDLIRWTGQLVVRAGMPFVRVWQPYEVVGRSYGQVVNTTFHGALVVRTVSGLGTLGSDGARTVANDPVVLDGRFRDLTELPDPGRVIGVYDLAHDPARFAVIDAQSLDDTGAMDTGGVGP